MIIIETCPKCGHDLFDYAICTNPPIPKKKCHNCGWTWEGQKEEIVRVIATNDNDKLDNNDYDLGEVLQFCYDGEIKTHKIEYSDGIVREFSFDEEE